MIIGILGVKGSGKDTVANMIRYYKRSYEKSRNDSMFFHDYIKDFKEHTKKVLTPDWIIDYFGRRLKESLSVMTGIPVERFYDREWKDSKLPDWLVDEDKGIITHRDLMQKFGTEVGRYINDRMWINTLFANHDDSLNLIIPDCRFQNEVDVIEKENGGFVIKLTRLMSKSKDLHDSEAVENIRCKYTLDNDGLSLEETYESLKYFLHLENV